jgi:hypothetical protein
MVLRIDKRQGEPPAPDPAPEGMFGIATKHDKASQQAR